MWTRQVYGHHDKMARTKTHRGIKLLCVPTTNYCWWQRKSGGENKGNP